MKYLNKSKIFTLSSTLTGLALISNFNAYEQNAIGNWLMLVGQILETNAAFDQLNSSKISNINDNNDFLKKIEKTLKIMEKEIENLK